MADVDEVQVTVKYDGPAVADGRMDARDLAPAMLATAHLYEHSAALIYGTNATINIDVKADFRRGSFSYDFVARAIIVGNTLFANLSISDIIATGTLMFVAVRAARGRKPREVVQQGDRSTIVFNDGDSITVNLNVAKLFLNPTIRTDIEGAVEPLKREGMSEFRVSTPSVDSVVSADEVDYFAAPDIDEEVLQDSVVTELVQVLAPHFREGNKWQFALAGEGTFWARILDREFLDGVRQHNIVFGSGDALRVEMRVRVTRKPNRDFDRLREIVKVIEHLPQEPPPSLFDDH